MLRNVLWLPNMVGRTLDPKCSALMPSKVMQRSVGVNLVSYSLGISYRLPNLIGRIPVQSIMHDRGSNNMQGSAGVNQRLIT